MEKRFLFSDVESVKKEIGQILDTVERGNRSRLIERWFVFDYLNLLEEHNYGYKSSCWVKTGMPFLSSDKCDEHSFELGIVILPNNT
jgi:hypothetical protein